MNSKDKHIAPLQNTTLDYLYKDSEYNQPSKLEVVEGGIIRGNKNKKELSLVFTGHDFADGAAHILYTLDENNVKFEIVDFISNPLSKLEIKTVLKKLNCTPSEILRKNEEEFKNLNLNLDEISSDELVDVLFNHPNLIQRPILIKGKIAMIGRPLENVKYFIEH